VGIGAITQADHEWTIQNFHNAALKHGSQAAVVVSADIFTPMSVKYINEVGDFKRNTLINTEALIMRVLQYA
jgi:hypothetical protein